VNTTSLAAATDRGLAFKPRVADGTTVAAGDTVATLAGPTRSVLAAERTVLNLLGRLSGIATAGLAEIAKYGVIRDASFFAWLEANAAALCARDQQALMHAIRRSCEIKAEVVAADERESDLRAILNYGHTFGHALETLTRYETLLHGEAVAIGMVQAADLSVRLGLLDAASAQRIKALVIALGLPAAPPGLSPDAMIDAMGADKKAVNGRLRLVLATRIGRVITTEEIDGQALFHTLAAGERLCR
jgi:3-dehydroquinate synthase